MRCKISSSGDFFRVCMSSFGGCFFFFVVFMVCIMSRTYFLPLMHVYNFNIVIIIIFIGYLKSTDLFFRILYSCFPKFFLYTTTYFPKKIQKQHPNMVSEVCANIKKNVFCWFFLCGNILIFYDVYNILYLRNLLSFINNVPRYRNYVFTLPNERRIYFIVSMFTGSCTIDVVEILKFLAGSVIFKN